MESDEFKINPDEDTSKHMRSLIFRNYVEGKTVEFPRTISDFHNFKLVKVLVFVRFRFAGRRLPRGIDKLIHLRMLCLQKCELDEIPSSIGNLVNLYSFELINSMNVRVPNVFKKMSGLKHLYLPKYDKENIGNYRLKLEEGLDELETLSGFDSLVHELRSITRMKNLRLLVAVVRDNEILSAILNAITTNSKDLRKCAVLIRQGCQFTSMDVEGSMNLTKVFTCSNLHQLVISNVKIEKLLEECAIHNITSNLVYLHLSDCEIEDDCPQLKMIPDGLQFIRTLQKN